MEMEDLKTEMIALFEQVDQRFGQVDRRFEQVDQRFEQIDQRFEQVDRQLDEMKAAIRQTQQMVADEGVRTRRHFEAVAEQMKAERNYALDQSGAASQEVGRFRAANAADHVEFERRLDDHEARLSRLEHPPR